MPHGVVSLTKTEFDSLLNGLCKVRNFVNKAPEFLSQNWVTQLRDGLTEIDSSLLHIYSKDDVENASFNDQVNDVADEFKFKSIWCVPIKNLHDKHCYPNTVTLVYEGNWGKDVSVELHGNTWVELWAAADTAITLSGDDHHVFIEGFMVSAIDPSLLVLSTGS